MSDIINFPRITACGECYDGCKKKKEGFCQGCIESDGHCHEWTGSGGCTIYKCTRDKNIQFCGLCYNFPCEWVSMKVTWNPDFVSNMKKLVIQYNNKQ